MKSYPPRITEEWLKRHHACDRAIANFRETFPNGVGRITASIVIKARAAKLDIEWFIMRVTGEHSGAAKECILCNVHDMTPKDLAAHLRSKQRAARQ